MSENSPMGTTGADGDWRRARRAREATHIAQLHNSRKSEVKEVGTAEARSEKPEARRNSLVRVGIGPRFCIPRLLTSSTSGFLDFLDFLDF
jgi:hypothetical protein